METPTRRVNDAAPFHPDLLHPSLRPTVYCPSSRLQECVSRELRRLTTRKAS